MKSEYLKVAPDTDLGHRRMNYYWRRKPSSSWLLVVGIIVAFPSCRSSKSAIPAEVQKTEAVTPSAGNSFSNIYNRLGSIIAKQLQISTEKIKPESDLVKDLGADSLDVVEIVMSIEKEFGISFSDKELEGMKRVSDIDTVIKKKSH